MGTLYVSAGLLFFAAIALDLGFNLFTRFRDLEDRFRDAFREEPGFSDARVRFLSGAVARRTLIAIAIAMFLAFHALLAVAWPVGVSYYLWAHCRIYANRS